jgi:hypothetical protein
MTFTARPPREVSWYLSSMSRPVSLIVLIAVSSHPVRTVVRHRPLLAVATARGGAAPGLGVWSYRQGPANEGAFWRGRHEFNHDAGAESLAKDVCDRVG